MEQLDHFKKPPGKRIVIKVPSQRDDDFLTRLQREEEFKNQASPVTKSKKVKLKPVYVSDNYKFDVSGSDLGPK